VRPGLRLYSLAAYLLAPVYCGALAWRGFRERGYWRGFGERLGYGPVIAGAAGAESGLAAERGPAASAAAAGARSLWLHAASVGEVQAAAGLVRALDERCPGAPLVITTMTPAGAARAKALLAALRAGGEADVRFLPLDLPGAVHRFFDRVAPRLGIIMETELWPNLFRECRRRRVPLVLASARLSERSARRYDRMRRVFEPTLAACALIAAQSEADAKRFLRLGAPPAAVRAVGNIKFDLEVPAAAAERGRLLRERYAGGRPMWVAGSTHDGEEQAALAAHALVRRAHPEALLVLAPRHPPRFREVGAMLERRQVAFARRSAQLSPAIEVLLLDTLGELLDLYAAADVVFVGGSLVPVGGHNLLEPAALGRPILTGPHHFNSPQIARLLRERNAVEVVHDARELGERVSELIAQPSARTMMGARARAVVEENRGALDRLVALIAPLLER